MRHRDETWTGSTWAGSVAFTRLTGRAYPHGSWKSCRKVLWPFGGQGFDGGARRSPIQCPKPRDVLRVGDCRAVGRQLLLTCEPFLHRLRRALPARTSTTQLRAEASHLQLPTSLEPFSGSKLDIANANNRSIRRIRRRIRDAKSRQVPITHQPTSTDDCGHCAPMPASAALTTHSPHSCPVPSCRSRVCLGPAF